MSDSWEQHEPNGIHPEALPDAEPAPHNHVSAEQATPAPPAAAPQGGNVDQIREILFGSHMRDYESRFVRLEQALLKEAADVREGARQRIDGLEAFLNHQLETLRGNLKAERDERAEASGTVSRELQEQGATLHRKIAEAGDQASHAQHELREQLAAKEREIGALLEKRFEELRKDKTDRSALAALFSEVASRLNHDPRIPGDTH